MGLVYLKQGNKETDGCSVHLNFYDEQQLKSLETKDVSLNLEVSASQALGGQTSKIHAL